MGMFSIRGWNTPLWLALLPKGFLFSLNSTGVVLQHEMHYGIHST